MIESFGEKRYLPKEAAKLLGVGKNKIYELLKNRLIEHQSYAGKTFITEHQINDFYVQNTVRKSTPKLYSRP